MLQSFKFQLYNNKKIQIFFISVVYSMLSFSHFAIFIVLIRIKTLEVIFTIFSKTLLTIVVVFWKKSYFISFFLCQSNVKYQSCLYNILSVLSILFHLKYAVKVIFKKYKIFALVCISTDADAKSCLREGR